MKVPTLLIVSTLWYGRANARNDTMLHGWQADPSGRGTWTILWTCLATIFICTWSALHLDIPKRHESGYLTLRKLSWMIIAAYAPEIVLYNAADSFFLAQQTSKYLKDKVHRTEWTRTHMQFAVAGGFRKRTSEGETSTITAEKLSELITNGQIPDPPISAEELKSRSRSDWIIKTVAILQIAWFGIQTLFRAVQHFQTTALEIMTVAFVFCSVAIYGFNIYLPQDVEYPVILDLEERMLVPRELTPIAPRPSESSVTEDHAFDTSAMEESAAQRPPLDRSSSMGHKLNGPGEELTITGEPGSTLEDGSEHGIKAKPQPEHERVESNTVAVMGSEKFKALPRLEIKSYQKGIPRGETGLWSEGTPEQDSVLKTTTSPTREPSLEELPGSRVDSLAEPPGVSKKTTGLPESKFTPSWIVETIPSTLFVVFACGFGAIHCLGWKSPFPTVKERLAWRICSVSTTALPLVPPLLWFIVMLIEALKRKIRSDRYDGLIKNGSYILVRATVFFYVVARITIIVLAFMSLRALPADAYQTVKWNQYIPHFAAS